MQINCKKSKAFIGNSDNLSCAIKIDALPSNDFIGLPFGRRFNHDMIVKEWKKDAELEYVRAKHEPTLKAVKRWIKENSPKEFYAVWQSDSTHFKDDFVDIYYK